jgi:hypothetical protein
MLLLLLLLLLVLVVVSLMGGWLLQTGLRSAIDQGR